MLNVKKETFTSEQKLTLKKIETRTSKEGNAYFMLFFNMCVKYDEENIRNNYFVNVPFSVTKDFMSDNFPGIKPKELIDKSYMLEVEFLPNVTTWENQKYAKFNTNVISMIPLEETF